VTFYRLHRNYIIIYKPLFPSDWMHISSTREIGHYQGNAERNYLKLDKSGIIPKIRRYVAKLRRNNSKKPLKISIPSGNPEDARVCLESLISQQQRKKLKKENTLPKGYTKSPKIGARNFAMAKGANPTDAANYLFRKGNVLIIQPEAAILVDDFANEIEYPGANMF